MSTLKLVPDWYIRASQLTRRIKDLEVFIETRLKAPKSKQNSAALKDLKLELKTNMYQLEQLEQNI